jgi:DNA-binding NtrC family response regulator
MALPSYRLLVIDDSKRDILLLERILRQAEDAVFTVTHVESAQVGLEELGNQPYDLVLLDYYLPDMDGLAFLEEKQARGLTTPVIMLTAFGQERLPVAAMQAGALDYFRKDEVNSSLLGKAIRQAIEKARLQADALTDAARLRELEATVAQLQQQLQERQGIAPTAQGHIGRGIGKKVGRALLGLAATYAFTGGRLSSEWPSRAMVLRQICR